MYVISDGVGDKPFAIIKSDNQSAVELAIKEEFSFSVISLMDKLNFDSVRWGDEIKLNYISTDYNGIIEEGYSIIRKICDYV